MKSISKIIICISAFMLSIYLLNPILLVATVGCIYVYATFGEPDIEMNEEEY